MDTPGLELAAEIATILAAVGLVASTIITVVLTFRAPTDIDQWD